MSEQPTSVPFEPYAQALSAQRNQALDQVAQLQAINHELQAQLEHERSENARLRGEAQVVPGQVSDAG